MTSVPLVLALAGLLAVSGEPEQRQQRQANDGVKVGQKAPNFKIDLLEEGKSFDLAANLGKQPVVLVFGSYT